MLTGGEALLSLIIVPFSSCSDYTDCHFIACEQALPWGFMQDLFSSSNPPLMLENKSCVKPQRRDCSQARSYKDKRLHLHYFKPSLINFQITWLAYVNLQALAPRENS